MKTVVCSETFSTKWNLKAHCQQVHPSQEKEVCGTAKWEQFRNGQNAENKPQCDNCGKRFTRLDNMKSHLAERTKLPCPQCSKTYGTKSNLNTHLKNAHGVILKQPKAARLAKQETSKTSQTSTNIIRRVDYNKKSSTKIVFDNKIPYDWLSPNSLIKVRKNYISESSLNCSDVELQMPSDPRSVEDVTDQTQKSANDYTTIENNDYVAKITRTDIQPCHCSPTDGCGDTCLNRLVAFECTPECVCGTNCKNSSTQKGNIVSVEIMPAHKGDLGAKTNVIIAKGTFIMEYVGEVIEERAYEERLNTLYANYRHIYGIALCNKFTIDAHRKGNLCRYVNHSCNPNCNMERWIVNGLPRLGLFAKRNIAAGEELTFNYNLHLYNNDTNIPCKCGSENCQGLLAKRPHFVMQFGKEKEKEGSKVEHLECGYRQYYIKVVT